MSENTDTNHSPDTGADTWPDGPNIAPVPDAPRVLNRGNGGRTPGMSAVESPNEPNVVPVPDSPRVLNRGNGGKPPKRPSDFKQKASKLAADAQAVAKNTAERVENSGIAKTAVKIAESDAVALRKELLVERAEGYLESGKNLMKRVAQLVALGVFISVASVIVSIVLAFKAMWIPAGITLGVAVLLILGSFLWAKYIFTGMAIEYGKEEAKDILFQLATAKRENKASKKKAAKVEKHIAQSEMHADAVN